ncbi:MAG: uncharacterized protein QOH58_1151 [Thermoleophilaceae bacterium]|jgi:predicted TIM-barrel fold metal-dependent hydrolase|nr:uncharacterized protein [Thermoleophilaceae bacterium]
MRDGHRVIDTDSHVAPALELLYEQGDPEFRGRWEQLKLHLSLRDSLPLRPGDWERPWLELAVAPSDFAGGLGEPADIDVEAGVLHDNPDGRLRFMDAEGIDEQLVLPGGVAAASTGLDVGLSTGLLAAYNRYVLDYCAADPRRLRAAIQVHGADPEWSVAEIGRHADAVAVAAFTICLPAALAIDDPALEPIWRAGAEADLPLVHHAFLEDTPYFPGYRDLWSNPLLARAAAHQWSAQRVIAALVLGGTFERWPRLRVAFGDSGAGWLPAWLHQLRGQVDGGASDRRDPVDYAAEGRICVALERHEGEAMAESVVSLLGEETLVWQSHFPGLGPESSPDDVLGWERLSSEVKGKALAGNAARCLRLL